MQNIMQIMQNMQNMQVFLECLILFISRLYMIVSGTYLPL